MGSLKNNIRSFRYTSEVAAMLEAQPGKSLNDKFEMLVTQCYYDVPARKKELEQVNEQIKARREKLYELSRQTQQLDQLARDLQSVKHYMDVAGRRAKEIAETEA